MAYNKIYSVTIRLDQSLNYIVNPEKTLETILEYAGNDEKTEKAMFVTAFNCEKDMAYADMIATQKRWGKYGHKGAVLAYHIIQSFPPNISSAEEIHQCGRVFVERYLSDKYEVVLSTHLNKRHLHNHIIFNSVSFMDGKKYRNNFKDYFIDIRGISDMISKEHGLPVIHPKGKGKHYSEWKAVKEGKPTIRSMLRQEVDQIIRDSYNFKTFVELLQKRGYTVKYGERVKHMAVKPPYSEKYIRLKSLGDNYTEDHIKLRLEAQRKGIRPLDTMERKPPKRYKLVKGSFGIFMPKKIKGFTALYLRYLYMLGKVGKRKTLNKSSFVLREEILKFERYQRQFRFLHINKIATRAELLNKKTTIEDEISELITRRDGLYTEKNTANTEEMKSAIQAQIAALNIRLGALRKQKRLCDSIEKDIPVITQKLRQTDALTENKSMEKEEQNHEHKR